jgi:DNA-3-methyladenine glycosylase
MKTTRIKDRSLFCRDVLDVAPWLLGKYLVRKFEDGQELRLQITEVEAYRGEDDLACHASKRKTPRNTIMFGEGGFVYMYFIYGMYWMLNIVTAEKENPQAILIRGIEGFNGPGKLTRRLQLDKSFYGEDICSSTRLWLEDCNKPISYITTSRIGIDYAGEPWKSMPWRFVVDK